ncbi:MAG: sigma-70 family RNA polymerase sigma factor [bacterium]|nr:MAG: sigma-70 family RNA polymerase sigma factor [bacterium]
MELGRKIGHAVSSVLCRTKKKEEYLKKEDLNWEVFNEDKFPSPTVVETEVESRSVVESSLNKLRPRQREIVKLVYFVGLTYEEIGQRFGLTTERVRQINVQALDRLKKINRW